MNSLSGLGAFQMPDLQALTRSKLSGAPSIPVADLKQLVDAPSLDKLPQMTDAAGDSFANSLGNMVREVNGKQNDAAFALRDLVSGNGVSLHQAMISTQEANLSFQLMVEVRNKLLESYQELMRMQI